MKRIMKIGLFLSAFLFFFSVGVQIQYAPTGELSVSVTEVSEAKAGNGPTAIGSGMFSNVKSSGNYVLEKLCEALNGYMGWMIILFGAVLGAWEYFVQRQGHMLVAVVIGIVAIIFIGKILKSAGACS